LRLEKCRKLFADNFGGGTILRLLDPALFNDLPDGFYQLRSFKVTRAIRTSLFLHNEFVEM
jgi:hypothetical protein